MAKLPVLKPQEVVSRLQALGFVEVRQPADHPVAQPSRRGCALASAGPRRS
jgi:predicted RNA binding protein YcfA (HicA-like mRNA interferase family)